MVCPNCGQANEPTRVYCSRCATELAAVTAPPIPVPDPTPSRSIPPVAIAGLVGAVILLGALAFVFLGPKSAPPSSGAVITNPPPSASAGVSTPPSAAVASPTASSGPSGEPSGEPASAPPPEPTGKLVFSAVKNGNADIYVWEAGDARPHKLFGGAGNEFDPAWSPDGSKVVFALNTGGFNPLGGTPDEGLRVIKADGTKAKVFDLTHHDVDRNPVWAPDGQAVVWASTREHADNKNLDIYSRRYEDTTTETPLADDPADDWDPAFSADGKTIVFVSKRDGPATLYTMTPQGKKQQPLDLGTGVYDDPTFSRVDDLLAYTMKASGGAQKQLFVAGQDGSDSRQLGSFTGDVSDPTWSPDAKLIAVANDDTGGIDIIDVATGRRDRLAQRPQCDPEDPGLDPVTGPGSRDHRIGRGCADGVDRGGTRGAP